MEAKTKKPLYGNWEIQAPDGQVQCRTLKKRADWYLERELADIIGENTIRLRFEPEQRRNPNDLYTISTKRNACVSCNTEDLLILTKHHIIPSEYRKHFPLELKSRSCHDIVAMCREHHNEYEKEADKLKALIAEETGYDLNRHELKDDIHQALKLSKVLLSDKTLIPQDRIDEIEADFIACSGITHLSRLNILEFCKTHENRTVVTHGEMVVKDLIKNDKLLEFTVRWRQHFLDTMNPQYMPEFWDINRKLYFE